MPSFPGAVKSFSTKTAGQTVSSAHINDLQDEVVAVETYLTTSAETGGVTYTWPVADGTTNQVLQTNGSRALAWVSSVAPLFIPVPLSVSTGLTPTTSGAFALATGTITISLPLPSGHTGCLYGVKNSAGGGTVTVNVSGGVVNIDSATTYPLSPGASMLVLCDGTQYWIVAKF
jgi:hypothetical protein